MLFIWKMVVTLRALKNKKRITITSNLSFYGIEQDL